MIALTPEPLDAAAFAPFGTVIAFDRAAARVVNEGTAERADTQALFDHAPGAAPVLALYRLQPQTEALRLTLFERHAHSTQSFVSLSVGCFLVVVAPHGPDGDPAVGEARAFLGRIGTGLSYRRNQWHTPVMAIEAGGDLLMLMAERGRADDCIEHRLAVPLTLRTFDPAVPESTTHGA